MTTAFRGRGPRTIWISDVHLGTRGCQAQMLLDFLRSHEPEYLYLIGDIVDGWRLKKGWYFPDTHTAIVQRIIQMAKNGTKVTYVPGNHDEMARDYCGISIGGVQLTEEAIHETADGQRLLILHGDKFDGIVKYARWLAFLGDTAYTLALALNVWFNVARRRLGYPYWSLSSYLKRKVKNAVEYISNFETALADEARRRGVDGVVCGHIHQAEIRHFGDVLYCNSGDWVESCTAIVEHQSGQLKVLRWADNANVPELAWAEAS
ncbi:MAG TPA: UDP-2,3-diacylglucosamine diphosphatase [Alphaproteobacteria bacterium]|nr:UDP-2,3-diacylglucosamine diphosphatase [Alphaproteobacteria bacterium]